jgi:hypothetical protein
MNVESGRTASAATFEPDRRIKFKPARNSLVQTGSGTLLASYPTGADIKTVWVHVFMAYCSISLAYGELYPTLVENWKYFKRCG